jgi:hypothetical protein
MDASDGAASAWGVTAGNEATRAGAEASAAGANLNTRINPGP